MKPGLLSHVMNLHGRMYENGRWTRERNHIDNDIWVSLRIGLVDERAELSGSD